MRKTVTTGSTGGIEVAAATPPPERPITSIRAALLEQFPYDVRVDADLAERRRLRRLFYRVARYGALVVADAAALSIVHWVSAERIVSPSMTAARPRDIAIVLLCLAINRSYRSGDERRSIEHIAGGLAIAAMILVLGAEPDGLWWWQPVVWLALALPLLWIERQGVDRLVRAARKHGYSVSRTLLLGDSAWAEEFRSRAHLGELRPAAVAGRSQTDGMTLPALTSFVRTSVVDTVVLQPPRRIQELAHSVRQFSAIGVRVLIDITSDDALGSHNFSSVRDRSWRALEVELPKLSLPQLTAKRTIDMFGAVIGLGLLSPVILAAAIATRLDSRGPVFFGQWRVGVGGRGFRMWKLRTMVADAEAKKRDLEHLIESGDPRLWKIRQDPRVTRVGSLLRRFSIDEIPQLYNVLRGEMSLVGPRPFFDCDLPLYTGNHFDRLGVVPGITGMWQVSGRSEITDFEEVVRLDREYIRTWSIGLDFKILAKTLATVVRRSGAM